MKVPPDSFARFQRIAGNLFFLVLVIYAVVYAVERTVHIDNAWIFACQVNESGFAATSERLPAFIPEIPLFLSIKLGLSIDVLVYVFSLSYIVFIYSIWWIATYRLRSAIAGLTIVFGTFIGIRELFVHPVTEVHQCIAYSALLYAILHAQFSKQTSQYFLVGLTAILTTWSHPLGLFTCGFVGVFYFTEKKVLADRNLLMIGIALTATVLMMWLMPSNKYDQDQFNKLSTGTASIDLESNGALNFLWIHMPHFYWLVLVELVLTLVLLSIKRQWLIVGAVVLGVIVYTIIAAITFRHGESSMMLERLFLPAFFMINLATAYTFYNIKFPRNWIAPLIICFFLVNGIRFINTGCLMYKKRVAYLDELVQKAIGQGNDKYFLSEELTDRDKILVPWALGTETLIYSKFRYDQCVSISMPGESCNPTEVRVTNFECLPVSELNPEYFQLSTNAYTELK